jgi:octaprenyl-diphosphate synthase
VWGNEASVLFGDYLFAKAFTLCARLGSHEANVILAQTTQDMCVGELSQISTKLDFSIDEGRYEEIIRLKTATLFGAACRLGSVGWETDRASIDALARYGEHFGMAFQIIDDCLDLTGDEREVGKSLGTDLAKGKLTLPVIRLLQRVPERKRQDVQEMIASLDGVAEKRRMIVGMLRECDIMSDCMRRAQHHLEVAKQSARELKEPLAEHLVTLAEFAQHRRA